MISKKLIVLAIAAVVSGYWIHGMLPTAHSAKIACDKLISDNPSLGISAAAPTDLGVASGRRRLMYTGEILGIKINRLCVFDGYLVQLPSIFEQSRYLN